LKDIITVVLGVVKGVGVRFQGLLCCLSDRGFGALLSAKVKVSLKDGLFRLIKPSKINISCMD
jgi:hypothetical protein